MITSLRNPHIQAARKLVKRAVRDVRREFLVEGPNGVEQALESGAPLTILFVAGQDDTFPEHSRRAKARGVPVLVVSSDVMRTISS
ncbi:MAG: RNA methyltransferase substrate-binding domain-containing protein, partial [Actinomycetota bacterium]